MLPERETKKPALCSVGYGMYLWYWQFLYFYGGELRFLRSTFSSRYMVCHTRTVYDLMRAPSIGQLLVQITRLCIEQKNPVCATINLPYIVCHQMAVRCPAKKFGGYCWSSFQPLVGFACSTDGFCVRSGAGDVAWTNFRFIERFFFCPAERLRQTFPGGREEARSILICI